MKSAEHKEEIYNHFKTLRSIFLGLASRYNSLQSRVVVYEEEYREFGNGPKDTFIEKWKSIGTGTIKEAMLVMVKPEERKEIKKNNPKARFKKNSAGEEIYYIQPAIHSNHIFNYKDDNGDALSEFNRLADDAGFLLVNLLNNIQYELNLPQLIPLEILTKIRIKDGSTKRPNNLKSRWLLFLHILGWQNDTISPLRAERYFWDETNATIMGDPENIHKMFGNTMFKEMISRIPNPPHYFGSDLLHCVNLASVYAIDIILSEKYQATEINLKQSKNDLNNLKSGKKDAYKYQKLIAKYLELIFSPQLKNPTIEQGMDGGQSRVDICFYNLAESGYFYNLLFRHQVKCPYIFFECKNYSQNIGSDEFNQLIGRLDKKTTMVGFIVCRNISNWKKIEQKCNTQYLKKGIHIIVLDDNDILTMLEFKANNENEKINNYLSDKLKKILLST